MAIRVMAVDDHPLMRDGLRLLVEAQDDMEMVGEAGDADEALARVRRTAPDVVIMDVKLATASGVKVTRDILAIAPTTAILVLSASARADVVAAAVKAGARGYMVKEASPADVLSAIRAVAAGHTFMCPEAARALVASMSDTAGGASASPAPSLTDREREVLVLVAEGLRTKEIAARLQIGVRTVDTHRAQLMKKLKCSSPAELVRYAIREGLASF